MSSSRIYVPNKAILVTSGGSFIAERASDYPFSNFQSSGRLESMYSTKLGNHTFFKIIFLNSRLMKSNGLKLELATG